MSNGAGGARRAVEAFMDMVVEQGGRRPRKLPTDIIRGTFLFKGVITDNATTASDLTASGVARSRKFLNVGGYTAAQADPKIVLVADGMGIALVAGTEAGDILADVATYLELQYTQSGANGYTRNVGLFPRHSTKLTQNIARATTDGLATELNDEPMETFQFEDGPFVVDFESDTFQVAPWTAVNSGANIPYVAAISGWAFKNSGFVPSDADPRSCKAGSGDDVADKLIHDAIFRRRARSLPKLPGRK